MKQTTGKQKVAQSGVQVSEQGIALAPPAYRVAVVDQQRLDTMQPRPVVQAKLTIGAPNDPYEREADRVATQVVQQLHAPASPAIQPQAAPEQAEKLQMKPLLQLKGSEGSLAAPPALESSIQQLRGHRQPLATPIRQPMERAFGADFSGVRVHTGTHADQLNQSMQAKAFTTGQDVFFRQGAYAPGSQDGQTLLAHELTHVVQQNDALMQRTLLPILTYQGASNNEMRIQRKIVDPTHKENLLDRYRSRFTKIQSLKKQIEGNKYDVDATEVYNEKLTTILQELKGVYDMNIDFELRFMSTMTEHQGNEHSIITAEDLMNLDLEDSKKEIDKFWQEVLRAYNIRKTLRTGAEKFRENSQRTIDQLYAGTLDDANEVRQNPKTVFTRLLKDETWFTDTNENKFVWHPFTRSGGIGLHPSGSNDIHLHIGHLNKSG